MFYLLLLIAAFIGGVIVGSKYSPKFSFTDNHLYMEYKNSDRLRKTKKLF